MKLSCRLLFAGFLLLALVTATNASTTVDQIVSQTKEALSSIEDFQTTITITQHIGKRSAQTVADLQLSVEYKLARVELSEPSALRGQIIVADESEGKVRIYLPVSDSIMVQDMAKMAENAGLATDLLDITSFFDFLELEIELVEIEETEDGKVFVLAVSGYDAQRQRVWVPEANYVPTRIEVYEKDKLTGVMELSETRINQGLEHGNLSALPQVREINY